MLNLDGYEEEEDSKDKGSKYSSREGSKERPERLLRKKGFSGRRRTVE